MPALISWQKIKGLAKKKKKKRKERKEGRKRKGKGSMTN